MKGRPVLDLNDEKIGILEDLIFIDGEKYAEVSHLVCVTDAKRRKKIPWSCVRELKDPSDNNKIDIDIHLHDAKENLHVEVEHDHELLLSKLLDKQLIDVDGLRIVRVNDVILGKVENKFCLVAVDVGARGLARRLGVERLAKLVFRNLKEHVIPWEYVEPLHGEITDLRVKIQRSKVADLRAADIADIMEDLTHQERVLIFDSLDNQKAAETLIEAQPDVQKSVVTGLKNKRIIEILESMPADEAAQLIEMMPAYKSEELLKEMKPENADAIKKLLLYSSDVAGGLMSTDFLTIPVNFTSQEAINRLRSIAPDSRHVYYLYVADEEGKLAGIISLRDLVISPADRKIGDFINADVIKVTVETPKEEVYKAMTKYNLMALPVVDLKGKLVGVISADEIIDLMLPKSLKKEKVRIKGQFRKRRRRGQHQGQQNQQQKNWDSSGNGNGNGQKSNGNDVVNGNGNTNTHPHHATHHAVHHKHGEGDKP